MNPQSRTRKRQQHGGQLPFFKKLFGSDPIKVDEKAELEKETLHLTTAMERLKRKLEAYERKMTQLESQLTYYQDLATNALHLHDIYQNGLAALKGEQEEEVLEDEESDEEGFPTASDSTEIEERSLE